MSHVCTGALQKALLKTITTVIVLSWHIFSHSWWFKRNQGTPAGTAVTHGTVQLDLGSEQQVYTCSCAPLTAVTIFVTSKAAVHPTKFAPLILSLNREVSDPPTCTWTT
jgi:hypothetical protein